MRVELYRVPLRVLEETRAYLVGEGKFRFEGFICWSGRLGPDGTASVRACIMPPGEGVNQGELFAHLDIHATAYIAGQVIARGEFLFAQLHTHPGRAFHSQIDDHGSISQRRGFLSIVVPQLGRRKFFTKTTLGACSVNEHEGGGVWREWTRREVRRRITVTDD